MTRRDVLGLIAWFVVYFFCRLDWFQRDDARDRWLVHDDPEAIVQSARLELWPRLDNIVCIDGDLGVVGLAPRRLTKRRAAARGLCRSIGVEYALVDSVF